MGRIPGKNVFTKIFMLFLAIVLWLYVTNEQNPSVEVSYQIALEVRNLAEDVVVLDAPEVIKIKLKGPRNLMANVRSQDLKAYVDLKGLGEGKHTVQAALAVPHALEVVETNPDKVALRLDRITKKEVPVEVHMSGTLPTGVAVAKLTPSVEKATVKGPKSVLDTINKVYGSIDAKGRETSFVAEVQLVVLGSDGKEIEGLSAQPGKINVAVQLAQGKFKKTVDLKVLTTGEVAKGFTLKGLQLKPEKLEISGEQQELQKIETISTEPINLKDVNRDTDIEVKLQLPEGVAAEKGTVTIRINVIKKP